MNLPNRLTMIRIIIIPVIVVLYLFIDQIGEQLCLLLIGVLFIIASLTDYFDGKIARKRNIVTTFGKFVDPLADKLLVISTLLILGDLYLKYSSSPLNMWMPFWVVLIVVARELIVTSIRLVAVGEGIILHASKWGKYKTATTMVTLAYYLFIMPLDNTVINLIGVILICLSVILTIGSGLDYFIKNKQIILKSI